jgi:8-oxo-dGTP diphosphatase
MKTKVITKAILARPDGDVLLMRRSATDPRRPLQWDFPGGNLEPGEHADDAAIREIQEESGLDVIPGSLQLVTATSDVFVQPDTKESTNLVWLFYVGKVADDPVTLSFEHDQFVWVKPADIPTKVTHPEHLRMVSYVLDNGLLAS